MNRPIRKSLPLHRAVRMTESGIFLKRIGPGIVVQPIRYAHRDDYYLFGFVEEGSCRIGLDFEEYDLHAGEMFCVRPGQVHRLVDEQTVRGAVLFVDAACIDAGDRRVLTEFAFQPHPMPLEPSLRHELGELFAMIDRRVGARQTSDAEETGRLIRLLAGAAVGMIAGAVRQSLRGRSATGRQVDLALAFRELLDRSPLLEGGPARYAAELHVSTGYLNEAVRAVAGTSVGRCIHEELMLRARRLLIHTSMNVREIAFELGFGDAAYFTRLFTKVVGISPSSFRRQYLG